LIYKKAYKKEKLHDFERIVVGKQSRFFYLFVKLDATAVNILFISIYPFTKFEVE
jgi:hypothetical protein